MATRINGFTLGYTAAGGIILWSGITGSTLSDTFQQLLKGQKPAGGDQPVSGPSLNVLDNAGGSSTGSSSSSSGSVPSTSDARTALQQAASAKGWGSGAEWTALQNVEMREAGFNPQAKNPSSGALGLAQALGHGTSATAGTLGNEYGGFGLSDAQAKEANSGQPGPQAVWMVNYIAATYGDPIKAWAHEQSAGWY